MSTKGQTLSVRCGRMVGRGRVKYQGRWVSGHWYNRYVLKKHALRKPHKKHEPVLVRFYMPPIKAVNEPAMEWLVDISCKARVREVVTVQDCYALPPVTELPTFFPPNPAGEPRPSANP